MNETSDYAMGDETKDYCKYCSRADGSMQSYDEKLEGTIDFLLRTQGMDPTAARTSAINIMSRLPAWKNRLPCES